MATSVPSEVVFEQLRRRLVMEEDLSSSTARGLRVYVLVLLLPFAGLEAAGA
jgi:hypothetical protein